MSYTFKLSHLVAVTGLLLVACPYASYCNYRRKLKSELYSVLEDKKLVQDVVRYLNGVPIKGEGIGTVIELPISEFNLSRPFDMNPRFGLFSKIAWNLIEKIKGGGCSGYGDDCPRCPFPPLCFVEKPDCDTCDPCPLPPECKSLDSYEECPVLICPDGCDLVDGKPIDRPKKPKDKRPKRPNEKPDDKPIDKPKDKPDDKPIDKPKEKPDDKPKEKPDDKPIDKPKEKPDDKPIDKPKDKPDDKPIDKPKEKPDDKPKEKPDDKPIDKPKEKPDDKPKEKPDDKPIDKPKEKPDDRPNDNFDEGNKPIENPDTNSNTTTTNTTPPNSGNITTIDGSEGSQNLTTNTFEVPTRPERLINGRRAHKRSNRRRQIPTSGSSYLRNVRKRFKNSTLLLEFDKIIDSIPRIVTNEDDRLATKILEQLGESREPHAKLFKSSSRRLSYYTTRENTRLIIGHLFDRIQRKICRCTKCKQYTPCPPQIKCKDSERNKDCEPCPPVEFCPVPERCSRCVCGPNRRKPKHKPRAKKNPFIDFDTDERLEKRRKGNSCMKNKDKNHKSKKRPIEDPIEDSNESTSLADGESRSGIPMRSWRPRGRSVKRTWVTQRRPGGRPPRPAGRPPRPARPPYRPMNPYKQTGVGVPSKGKNPRPPSPFSGSRLDRNSCGRADLNSLTPPGGQSGYIVNGEDELYGEWPAFVKLTMIKGMYMNNCGGVLISNRHVLTAAHCTVAENSGKPNKIYYKPSQITINVADHSERKDFAERTYEVSHICPAPNYSDHIGPNTVYDYAVLTLSREVAFSEYVQTACLPEEKIDAYNAKCFAVGAGVTRFKVSQGQSIPTFKDKVQKMQVTQTKCSEKWNFGDNDPSRSCFTKKHGQGDTCSGDSGGPILCLDSKKRWTVVALVSYGSKHCDGTDRFGWVGVYANVPKLLDEIKSNCRI